MFQRMFSIAIVALALTGCVRRVEPTRPTPKSRVQSDGILISFDDSAANLMLATLQRGTLSDQQARELVANRGVDAIIRKSLVWDPSEKYEHFIPYVRSVLAGNGGQSVFNLEDAEEHRAEIESLTSALRMRRDEIGERMLTRLRRYAPSTGPVAIEVFFVAGGSSDGFVLDDDPRPAFFVALDKASGDIDGVEQNMTHELYHVLQKASIRRSASAAKFQSTISSQPVVPQLLATTLWEGTANFAADARETAGSGPYVSMWRGRYERNLGGSKLKETFRNFDRVVSDLDAGRITWSEAYDQGFTGNVDSAFYFVGMEMARALASKHGAGYFAELFTAPPSQFFRDYLALAVSDPALPQFSQSTRAIIEKQSLTW